MFDSVDSLIRIDMSEYMEKLQLVGWLDTSWICWL